MSDQTSANKKNTDEAAAKPLIVPKGTKVQASVEKFLRERQIRLVYEEPSEAPKGAWHDARQEERFRKLFVGPDGGFFEEKPEGLTHLKGLQLVHKDHPLIIWRGKMDSLAADIIDAQERGMQRGNDKFVNELEEILDFTHKLLSCEFSGRQVDEFKLLGLDAAELRERSHNPKKFYGCPHLMASCQMGSLGTALNKLRTRTRETELVAVKAFKDNPRDDIIQALNRLSSLFYIMIYSYLPEGFKGVPAGI